MAAAREAEAARHVEGEPANGQDEGAVDDGDLVRVRVRGRGRVQG